MRIGIDIGGTFTDIVAVRPDGHFERYKLLSTPDDYGRAILQGIRQVLDTAGLSGSDVKGLIHGTTVATNAILSETGARTGLITTRGFRDVLEIGRLRTPRLYDLSYEKPKPLVPRRFRLEVTERVAADGTAQVPLDEKDVQVAIERLKAEGIESVAVCLLNAYVNPAHEQRIGEMLRDAGSWFVTLSSEVLPEIREYERTSTTVVNAYILPVVQTYLRGLREKLRGAGIDAPLRIMQSAGGITDAEVAAERPVQIVESGPAAGVVAAAALGRRIGCPDMITLDMGGTTAKASLIEEGRIPRAADYEVGGGISLAGRLLGSGGYPIRVPCIDLAEIGAGGGSLLRVDPGGALQVGPDSAGADPGPVCYGRGGTQPTLTDANLLLGYLNPAGLAGGALPLDLESARRCFEEAVAGPLRLSAEEAALGAHRIAGARMVRAVRAVSAERGRDPRKFILLAFGGNGPLHAVDMARTLEIPQVLVPPSPGLFSAVGLLAAGLQRDLVRTCLRRIERLDLEQVRALFGDMEQEALRFLPGARLERSADLRYVGQSYELNLPVPDGAADLLGGLRAAFEAEHERTYGHRAETDPVEVVALRLRAALPAPDLPMEKNGPLPQPLPDTERGERGDNPLSGPLSRRAYFGAPTGWVETPVLSREGLPSDFAPGPMIVEDYDATTVVPPGAKVRLDEWGDIVIEVG